MLSDIQRCASQLFHSCAGNIITTQELYVYFIPTKPSNEYCFIISNLALK